MRGLRAIFFLGCWAVCGFSVLGAVGVAEAKPKSFVLQSTTRRVPVLELFTSEGCSSCPPAERFFSGVMKMPGLWNEFIPVGWHVDYFDSKQWSDPWSQSDFSQRQRVYYMQSRVTWVYTPGFVLDGWEWTGFQQGKGLPSARQVERAGVLTVGTADWKRWAVRYQPVGKMDDTTLEVSLVYLGCGLKSQVKGGENSGRNLEHDFVVLKWVRIPVKREGLVYVGGGAGERPELEGVERLAVAAWLSTTGAIAPVQAVGGWAPPGGGGGAALYGALASAP